ncbi:hypothetical protein DWB68_00960 [Galactobacter valiniphilus]|uniref:DNA-binding protein n=1 Tax=Galactobacter valiniphilus TaxID=2676122 RepID=A0A399JLU2_9MICC|nr:helix-hairpin-helix domain-containing protein [Galactobacter valiniphilus]RII43516.1 hypothetical protein DWB68_00960 [Galactobacter valiniphilus]
MSQPEHAADNTEFPRAIGRPAAGALLHAGVSTWAALAAWSRTDLAALHGVGPKALAVLDAGLAEQGLSWREA